MITVCMTIVINRDTIVELEPHYFQNHPSLRNKYLIINK